MCVQALCRAAGEVVDAMLKAVNKDPEDEPPLDVVAGLYSDKTAGGWLETAGLWCVCVLRNCRSAWQCWTGCAAGAAIFGTAC